MLLHSSRNKFMVKFSKTVLASKNVVESIIYLLFDILFCSFILCHSLIVVNTEYKCPVDHMEKLIFKCNG